MLFTVYCLWCVLKHLKRQSVCILQYPLGLNCSCSLISHLHYSSFKPDCHCREMVTKNKYAWPTCCYMLHNLYRGQTEANSWTMTEKQATSAGMKGVFANKIPPELVWLSSSQTLIFLNSESSGLHGQSSPSVKCRHITPFSCDTGCACFVT